MVEWLHNEGTNLIELAHIRQSCVSQIVDFRNSSNVGSFVCFILFNKNLQLTLTPAVYTGFNLRTSLEKVEGLVSESHKNKFKMGMSKSARHCESGSDKFVPWDYHSGGIMTWHFELQSELLQICILTSPKNAKSTSLIKLLALLTQP